MSRHALINDRGCEHAQQLLRRGDSIKLHLAFSRTGALAREVAAKRNRYGLAVEEFEIQFIDGERIDAALADAFGLHQGDVAAFFDSVEDSDDHEKLGAIIAVSECGHVLSLESCDPDDVDLDIYEAETLRDLAEQFVDEGLFGDIPEQLQFYIDHDAIARDLAAD